MKSFTNTVLMVRPKNFGSNPETIENNAFQSSAEEGDSKAIKKRALKEFDIVRKALTDHDIDVIVVEDTNEPVTYDAIFPNNWMSTHHDRCIVTYPMFSPIRREERREDLVEQLQTEYGYKKRYAFEYHEESEDYLEGTGSMILDRDNRIVYACLGPRTSIVVLEKFAVLLGYRKVIFHGVDEHGMPVYHTNVMMCLAKDLAIVCMSAIQDEQEKRDVIRHLEASGREIIDISFDQMRQFAGNMLQLKSKLGEYYLIMSESAYKSLDIKQIDKILSKSKIIKVDIPTIQKYGGGGVRCMLAEIF